MVGEALQLGFLYRYLNKTWQLFDIKNEIYFIRDIRTGRVDYSNEFNLCMRSGFSELHIGFGLKDFTSLSKFVHDKGEYKGVFNVETEVWQYGDYVTYMEIPVILHKRKVKMQRLIFNNHIFNQLKGQMQQGLILNKSIYDP